MIESQRTEADGKVVSEYAPSRLRTGGARGGGGEPRKRRLDEFHWHEASGRACIVVTLFADFEEEHPVVQQTLMLRRSARELTERRAALREAVSEADPANEVMQA